MPTMLHIKVSMCQIELHQTVIGIPSNCDAYGKKVDLIAAFRHFTQPSVARVIVFQTIASESLSKSFLERFLFRITTDSSHSSRVVIFLAILRLLGSRAQSNYGKAAYRRTHPCSCRELHSLGLEINFHSRCLRIQGAHCSFHIQ